MMVVGIFYPQSETSTSTCTFTGNLCKYENLRSAHEQQQSSPYLNKYAKAQFTINGNNVINFLNLIFNEVHWIPDALRLNFSVWTAEQNDWDECKKKFAFETYDTARTNIVVYVLFCYFPSSLFILIVRLRSGSPSLLNCDYFYCYCSRKRFSFATHCQYRCWDGFCEQLRTHKTMYATDVRSDADRVLLSFAFGEEDVYHICWIWKIYYEKSLTRRTE